MTTPTITNEQREAIANAVRNEHDCSDLATCDIAMALRLDLPIFAAWMLAGATECENTSAALKAVGIHHDHPDLQREWAKVAAIPYLVCSACNAHNRYLDGEDPPTECGSCLSHDLYRE